MSQDMGEVGLKMFSIAERIMKDSDNFNDVQRAGMDLCARLLSASTLMMFVQDFTNSLHEIEGLSKKSANKIGDNITDLCCESVDAIIGEHIRIMQEFEEELALHDDNNETIH